MSPEKEKILFEKYPRIFKKEDSGGLTGFYGFECYDGWFDLLDVLCNKIQSHIDWRISSIQDPTEAQDFQVTALQVKEKIGGLRFYVGGGDDVIDAFISFAESMSHKICETCGNPGKQQGDRGWIHTACDPCFEKRAWRKTP